jgi:alcohol dehydrogenase
MKAPPPQAAGIGQLRAPGTVRFGIGSHASLGRLASSLGERITICTDARLANGPHVARATRVLRAAGLTVSVLDAAAPELPIDVIEAAVGVARGQRPDCLVGLGGGSCLDLAKLVSLGLSHDGPASLYYGENQVPGPVLPTIGVPTTAGTGSEVTPVAVLFDAELDLKVGISSGHLIPRAAICDPELTLGAPTHVTAHAGIDALAHAIEAYTAMVREDWKSIDSRVFVGKNTLSDTFALSAVRHIAPHLATAIEDNLGARSHVLEGSLRAALAFGTAGTAAAHALQYPLGAKTRTPHGLGIGLLLPYVMAFNRPAREPELARIADAMGCEEKSADAAIAAVASLAREIGLPASLKDIGVAREDLEPLAEGALTIDRLVSNNPRELTLAGAVSILEAAWFGDISRVSAEPSYRTELAGLPEGE